MFNLSYIAKSTAIMEPRVLKKVSHEEERSNFNAVTIADIDRTMKKYADNLLHALEGVSSKLAQLEGRTHHLEDSVGELKLTVGNYNGSTDGKLRQFENTLQEVSFITTLLPESEYLPSLLLISLLLVCKGPCYLYLMRLLVFCIIKMVNQVVYFRVTVAFFL
jgi:L-tryptophan--pyruvate aminotransferase